MSKNKGITIAIDGYSSCGKSTLAKDLARKLHYIFIDSGAMYRAVTLYAIEHHYFDSTIVNEKDLIASLDQIEIEFRISNTGNLPDIYLNNRNVSEEIRSTSVSNAVSLIASIPEVRHKLVAIQRKIGENGGIVMDGRDIGSVVFPDAELKFFVTADIEVRTDRRFNEMINKGIQVSRQEIRENLIERDRIDSTREISPLKQVQEAILLDNSAISREQQLDLALQLVDAKLNKQN